MPTEQARFQKAAFSIVVKWRWLTSHSPNCGPSKGTKRFAVLRVWLHPTSMEHPPADVGCLEKKAATVPAAAASWERSDVWPVGVMAAHQGDFQGRENVLGMQSFLPLRTVVGTRIPRAVLTSGRRDQLTANKNRLTLRFIQRKVEGAWLSSTWVSLSVVISNKAVEASTTEPTHFQKKKNWSCAKREREVAIDRCLLWNSCVLQGREKWRIQGTLLLIFSFLSFFFLYFFLSSFLLIFDIHNIIPACENPGLIDF